MAVVRFGITNAAVVAVAPVSAVGVADGVAAYCHWKVSGAVPSGTTVMVAVLPTAAFDVTDAPGAPAYEVAAIAKMAMTAMSLNMIFISVFLWLDGLEIYLRS